MAQKITVLFVEDDEGVRQVLPELLSEDEFRPIVAASGYEAMRLLAEEHVDVLFTDLVMAGMDGVELAKQAMLMRPELRVVFMTGYLSRAEAAGRFATLLYKPMRAHEIEAAIRKVLMEPAQLH